jgi:tetratricopeptide (TPR) repeat protein
VAGASYYVWTNRPDYQLRQGRAALARGDWDEAVRRAENFKSRGQTPYAHLLQGDIWLTEGKGLIAQAETSSLSPSRQGELKTRGLETIRRALKELAQVQDDGPLTAEATVLAGECLYRLDEKRLAEEGLTTLVQTHPDLLEAHKWLAAIFMDLNSPMQAIDHLTEWGRLDPDNGLPYRWIGFFYKGYSRPDQAAEAYAEALRRKNLSPELRAEVVREWSEVLAVGKSKYQEALAVLDQCPEAYRQEGWLLARRADCLRGQGQLDEAARCADEAVRAAPDLVDALMLRGRLYLDFEKPREALPLLEKAIRLAPYELKIHQDLLTAYKQLGDEDRASKQERLVDGLRKDLDNLSKRVQDAAARPWDDGLRVEIAKLCRKLGRQAEARTWLQAALACNPTNREARTLLTEEGGRGAARSTPVP